MTSHCGPPPEPRRCGATSSRKLIQLSKNVRLRVCSPATGWPPLARRTPTSSPPAASSHPSREIVPSTKQLPTKAKSPPPTGDGRQQFAFRWSVESALPVVRTPRHETKTESRRIYAFAVRIIAIRNVGRPNSPLVQAQNNLYGPFESESATSQNKKPRGRKFCNGVRTFRVEEVASLVKEFFDTPRRSVFCSAVDVINNAPNDSRHRERRAYKKPGPPQKLIGQIDLGRSRQGEVAHVNRSAE